MNPKPQRYVSSSIVNFPPDDGRYAATRHPLLDPGYQIVATETPLVTIQSLPTIIGINMATTSCPFRSLGKRNLNFGVGTDTWNMRNLISLVLAAGYLTQQHRQTDVTVGTISFKISRPFYTSGGYDALKTIMCLQMALVRNVKPDRKRFAPLVVRYAT